MQILLVHLSDIHLSNEQVSALSRSEEITHACHGAAPNAAGCVMVLSGDIAFSGQTSQYDMAYSLLTGLRERLMKLPSISDVSIIAVPGNHDCNFTAESDIRHYLLKDIQALCDSDITPNSDRVKAILDVQANFFAFEARLTNGKEVSLDQRLNYGRIAKFG